MALSALMQGVSSEESGGDYSKLGKITKNGDRAYGKYQVMGNNIPDWTQQILGVRMTPEQFLANPQAQELVSRAKLGEYLSQTGSPADAASMWFTGKPYSQGAGLRDANGTTGAQYVANVTGNGGIIGGPTSSANLGLLTGSPQNDFLGSANPVAASVAATAAAGIAPKAPAQLGPPQSVLDQPTTDFLGTAAAPSPASSNGSALGWSVTETPPERQAGPATIAPPPAEPAAIAANVAANTPSPASGGMMTDPGGGLEFMNSFPLVGPYLLKAGAASNALVSPYLGSGAPGASDTFAQRYANELALQKEQMGQFESQYPGATLAARIGGGILGTAPMVAAAPALFGAGSAPWYVNALAGGATNAGLSGADTAIRGGSDQDVQRNALLGGAAGIAGPVAGALVGGGARLLSGGLSDSDAALAQDARNFGIPLSASDLAAPNSLTKFGGNVLAKIPGSGVGSFDALQRSAFERAAASTIGENAPALTSDVMANAKARIGATLDAIESRTSVHADPKFDNDMLAVMQEAGKELPTDDLKRVNNLFEKSIDAIDPGTRTISGDAYRALTRTGTPLDRAISSENSNVSYWASQIKDVLDDAFERSASPADLSAFQTARGQYKNLKTLEPLVAKAPDGGLSPASLLNRMASNPYTKGSMAYGGAGDLGRLAQIGNRFLKATPSSGTWENSLVGGALLGAGSTAGYLMNNPLTGAATIGGPILAGNLLGRLGRADWITNPLINRSISGYLPGAVPAAAMGNAAARNALTPQ